MHLTYHAAKPNITIAFDMLITLDTLLTIVLGKNQNDECTGIKVHVLASIMTCDRFFTLFLKL